MHVAERDLPEQTRRVELGDGTCACYSGHEGRIGGIRTVWWSDGGPIGPREYIDRRRLRRAALRYAAHGWAVTPGAYLTGHRFACGRPGCPIMGCHPAIESFQDHFSTDPARLSRWWRRRPYTVLLATGGMFDVLEVPAAVGRRAIGPAGADARGPVAAMPAGPWMFLVRPDADLRPELGSCLDIVRHGRGSWIPAPPSRTPAGPVRWAVAPARLDWHLPGSAAVQSLLLDALEALGRRPRPAAPVRIPRQMSTARRAA